MTGNKVCLRKNDFNFASGKTFSDLYLNTEFSDVTLVSQDGNYVHAHKLIISAGSLELRKQILSLKQQHVLNIKTNFDDLKQLLSAYTIDLITVKVKRFPILNFEHQEIKTEY